MSVVVCGVSAASAASGTAVRADVLADCISNDLLDFEVLVLMMGPICHEDYLDVARTFVNSALKALEARGYGKFDADKGGRVVWTLQKANNMGAKAKKPPPVCSLRDLMDTLDNLRAQ